MENQTALSTASQSEARAAPYAPPTASFVPLRLEERLGNCVKENAIVCQGQLLLS